MIRHLFVPGLLGPVVDADRSQSTRLPQLEAVLARADRLDEPRGFAPSLFALFGVALPDGAQLPTAAVCYLGETGKKPPGYLLHADPLQLHPDRDHLLAFDLVDAPLGAAERSQLVDAFNAHFHDDGLCLISTPEQRLYLHSADPPLLQTHPLKQVVGRNIDGFLPHGEDQRRWRGLLNEVQMLCHSLDLNRRRERDALPLLGGLWFSGGGRVPDTGRGPIGRLEGDCPLSRGLLSLRSATGEDELYVDHALDMAVMRNDGAAWLEAVGRIEDRLTGLLADGTELRLHPGSGKAYRWHARAARRFWRRRRPLFDYLEAPSQ